MNVSAYMEGDPMRPKMSNGGWTVVAAVLSATVLLAGCETPPDRLNAPPQGQTDRPSELQDNYVRMVDNALLNERSMSAAHFVSGSAELNALGVRRLKRYATLLSVYGGELNYDGVEDKPELSEQRVYQIEQFLVTSGVGPDFVSVGVGPAGGRGMRAGECLEIREGMTATACEVRDSRDRIVRYQTRTEQAMGSD
jgi:hypothetical protein